MDNPAIAATTEELLDAWREAERILQATHTESVDYAEAETRVEEARLRYQARFEEIKGPRTLAKADPP